MQDSVSGQVQYDTPQKPLQNNPSGQFGGWAILLLRAVGRGNTESVDRQCQRVGIPADPKTAHDGLQKDWKRTSPKPSVIPPPPSPPFPRPAPHPTQLVKGLKLGCCCFLPTNKGSILKVQNHLVFKSLIIPSPPRPAPNTCWSSALNPPPPPPTHHNFFFF